MTNEYAYQLYHPHFGWVGGDVEDDWYCDRLCVESLAASCPYRTRIIDRPAANGGDDGEETFELVQEPAERTMWKRWQVEADKHRQPELLCDRLGNPDQGLLFGDAQPSVVE